MVLNEERTPWFFHQANYPPNKKSQPHNPSSGDNESRIKPGSLSDQRSSWSSEIAPNQILPRRQTLNEQQINDFTWIQDRDPGYGDLLIIRLGREGKIDKPLVLLASDLFIINNRFGASNSPFRSSNNSFPSFFFPIGVDVGLIKGKRGVHLLREHSGFFSSDHQFCAILPLVPAVYQGQRRKSKKSSIFGPLEKLLDLDGLYRLCELECSSHGDCRGLQVKGHPNEARDEEDSAESNRGSCDEDTCSDDGSGSDYVEEEEKEEEEEDKDHGDNDDNDNDGNSLLDISRKRYQRLENVPTSWTRHKWPKEKDRILKFAGVALRLDSATAVVYKMKDIGIFGRDEELLPVSLITPVREFGKSFLLVERTEKRSSLSNESPDNQSYVDSDTERTLVGLGDKGTGSPNRLQGPFDGLQVSDTERTRVNSGGNGKGVFAGLTGSPSRLQGHFGGLQVSDTERMRVNSGGHGKGVFAGLTNSKFLGFGQNVA